MEFLIVKFRKWKVELFELMWNLESEIVMSARGEERNYSQ